MGVSESSRVAASSMAQVADLHHIGIATWAERHNATVENLVRILGGSVEYEVEDDPLDVLATWVLVSDRLRFEVVSPRSDRVTPIARFLATTGGGLHHVSLATEQIGTCQELAAMAGARIIGQNDDHGGWAEFFIDPQQTGGGLLHWMQALDTHE